MTTTFFELESIGVISFSGEDAVVFLHAQLTSDVTGLPPGRTQYSGYCSPKGRLLATFLLWRRDNEILMLIPDSLREAIQSRLTKYVMRARVTVADATVRYAIYGLSGTGAPAAVAGLCARAPRAMHEVACGEGVEVTRLPVDRYLMLATAGNADAVRTRLLRDAVRHEERGWSRLDLEAGIAVITPDSQDAYVPQMVNLDLIGGVSYTKGCYPGQEIVARMHYLGKLKQRMYRVRVQASEPVRTGDPLYSREFGPDQASGAVLSGVGYDTDTAGNQEALAVIQKSCVEAGSVHLGSIDGPNLDFVALPYPLPA